MVRVDCNVDNVLRIKGSAGAMTVEPSSAMPAARSSGGGRVAGGMDAFRAAAVDGPGAGFTIVN